MDEESAYVFAEYNENSRFRSSKEIGFSVKRKERSRERKKGENNINFRV